MKNIFAYCIKSFKGSLNGKKKIDFLSAFFQVFPATGGEFWDPDVVVSTTNRDPGRSPSLHQSAQHPVSWGWGQSYCQLFSYTISIIIPYCQSTYYILLVVLNE